MKVSVVICTWNRARLLDRTLQSLTGLNIPAGADWEVLVVDNNCTDDTNIVVNRYSDRLPVKTLHEPEQGHANARNRAISNAGGQLILWTDDDVRPGPSWLDEYVRAARKFPDAAFFGGPIRPEFEDTPPPWLSSTWTRVSNAYAVRDLGTETFELDERRVPYGANFAVRTAVQCRYPFDPHAGNRGTTIRGGDETVVLRTMLADGHTGRWVPDAIVHHYIPRGRQTSRYLRRYFHSQGVTRAARRLNPNRGTLPVVQPPPRWRAAVAAELKYRFRRVFCGPEVWIEDLKHAGLAWGELSHRSKSASTLRQGDHG